MQSFRISSHQVVKASASGFLLCVLAASTLTACTTLPTVTQQGKVYGVPVTQRTMAQRLLDTSIKNTARLNISSLAPNAAKTGRPNIYSFYSNVLLTGEVPTEDEKRKIEGIIAAMPDVENVYNYLNVMPKRGASFTVNDQVIASKIKSQILASKLMSISQVKVVVDKGVVYVLGKLTPSQRSHLMNIVSNTAGVAKQIFLAQLIDANGAVIKDGTIIQEAALQPPTYQGYNRPNSNNDSGYNTNNSTTINTNTTNPSGYSQPSYPQPQPSYSPSGYPSNYPNYVSPSYPTTTQSGNQPSNQLGNQPAETSPYIELYRDQVPGWSNSQR